MDTPLVVIYGVPQAAPAKEQPRKSSGVERVQGDLRMSLAALRGEPLPLETPAAQVAAKARPTESVAPPIADGAVLVNGLEGSTVSNLVRKGETRWEADVKPARAGKMLRAAVEVRAYGEPVGRANAEAR